MEMQASNENESYNRARGLAPPSKSPAVRVHINVESNKPPAQEVIRKVTQVHEVVEVDGFVFKRKRSNLEPTATTTEQNQPADKKPKLLSSTPDAPILLPTVSNTPVPLAATAVEGDVAANIAAVKTPVAQAVSAATTALLEQLPLDVSEPDRMASLCELLCAAELDELSTSSAQEQQLDPAVTDAVRQVLGTFVHAMQSSAAAGRFQAAPPAEVQGAQQQDVEEEDDMLFSVDLEARKAGLRAQLAVFAKEEEEWQEVLAQQDSFQRAAEPVRHAAQATGKPGGRPGGVQAAEGVDAVDAAQAQVSSDAVGTDSKGEAMQADAIMPAAKDQPEPIMAIEGSSVLLQSGAGLLRKAEVDAHRKVAMQVEGLCSMVSGVEELVAKAERHCTAMQAKYHQDRFRAYLHVDSPAKLIQELLKPSGAVPSLPL